MEKENLFMNEGGNSTAPTWSSCNFGSEQVNNCYLNPNWDNSMDQSDPFESALSSIVSSPAASNATTSVLIPVAGSRDNVMIRELIGRLGNICNSGEISPQSCIQAQNNNNNNNTPLNLPPNFNLSMIRSSSNLPIHAARLSCFPGPGTGSQMKSSNKLSRSSTPEKEINAADSKEDSSLSDQIPSQTVTDSNPRKRKSIPKSKPKETPSTNHPKVVAAENTEESNSKRSKQDESDKDNSKAVEPPKDYIHVRARRGQATDSHSLAERVRREKISERMNFLQDLVPGCNKVTGKAVMLDEIINYVQSLQRQVEFLSMKLSTVNPGMDFNMEALLSKDMFQSRGCVQLQHHSLYPMAQTFPLGYQPQQGLPLTNQFSINPLDIASSLHRNPNIQLPPVNNGYDEAGPQPQVPSLWEDDLQSLVQMGFNQNQMKNEM